jgi:hypothetical protein
VTPYTYTEEFVGDSAVMSRDNLKIGFRVHTVWRVDAGRVPLFMERYSTTVDRDTIHRDPDAVVKVAYANFVKEPLRTFALDEVQRRNGLEVKDALIAIGDAVLGRIRTYAAGSPFIIDSVVVGNVQYPEEVANAVSRKARRDAGAGAQGHRDRDRTQGAHQARSARRRVSPTRWRSSAGSSPRCTSSTKRSKRRRRWWDHRITRWSTSRWADGRADHGDDGCDERRTEAAAEAVRSGECAPHSPLPRPVTVQREAPMRDRCAAPAPPSDAGTPCRW